MRYWKKCTYTLSVYSLILLIFSLQKDSLKTKYYKYLNLEIVILKFFAIEIKLKKNIICNKKVKASDTWQGKIWIFIKFGFQMCPMMPCLLV